MASKFVILVGLLSVVLVFPESSECQRITLTVGIEYDTVECGVDLTTPSELGLSLLPGSSALDIMEGAANISRDYRFVMTFLGDQGYSIDAINGTMSNEHCQWHLVLTTSSGNGSLAQLHHVLPDQDISMAILHYTTRQEIEQPLVLMPRIESSNLTVYYVIEYEENCNNGTSLASRPLMVTVSEGDTALHVLENALHSTNDSQYQFTSTYFGSLGYHVHTINRTSDNARCFWIFYYKEPNGTDAVSSQVGLQHYVIPGSNYTIIMRFVVNPYIPSDSTSDSPSDSTSYSTSDSTSYSPRDSTSVATLNTPLGVVILLVAVALMYTIIIG